MHIFVICILLVSPYNSDEGNISLFNALDCQVLATKDPASQGVPVLLNSTPKLRTITASNVNELLDKSYKHFSFSKPFNEAKNEPLVCLHTSGTTGLPKPVIYSHDFVSTYMRMAQLASPEGLKLIARKLDAVWYGGSDLPQQFGDTITSKFKFWNSNGSTETSPFPNIYKSGEWPAEDWKYQCTHPAAGLKYRIFSDDDQLYEAVIIRNSDPEFEQPVFKLYPDLKEYSTRNLLSPNPTKEGLWIYRGRTDDMILVVVDNVATRPFNSQYVQHAVTDHTDVKDGVMVPAGKFFNERFVTKTALLVDLKDGIDSAELGYKERLIEEIWNIVNGINKKYREEAWVRKECMIVAEPQKPLPRNPKGSVQRARAMESYAKELESL